MFRNTLSVIDLSTDNYCFESSQGTCIYSIKSDEGATDVTISNSDIQAFVISETPIVTDTIEINVSKSNIRNWSFNRKRKLTK